MEGNSSGSTGTGRGGAAPSNDVGGGNDVELLCKTLYLKISEKTSVTMSTIIVSFSNISWFLDLFNYYVNSNDQDVLSKELQLDTKELCCTLMWVRTEEVISSRILFQYDATGVRLDA